MARTHAPANPHRGNGLPRESKTKENAKKHLKHAPATETPKNKKNQTQTRTHKKNAKTTNKHNRPGQSSPPNQSRRQGQLPLATPAAAPILGNVCGRGIVITDQHHHRPHHGADGGLAEDHLVRRLPHCRNETSSPRQSPRPRAATTTLATINATRSWRRHCPARTASTARTKLPRNSAW